MKNLKYFYIEPYVYINYVKHKAILYNTLSHKYFIFDNPDVINFIKDLKLNNYVYEVNDDTINKTELTHFIKTMLDNYFGDFVKHVPGIKPFVFSPHIVIKEKYDEQDFIYEKITDQVYEVTLFLNGNCEFNCQHCGTAYRQINTCTKNESNIFDYNIFLKLLQQLNGFRQFSYINILGGNLTKFNLLQNYVSLLEKLNAKKIIYFNAIQCIEYIEILNSMNYKNTIIIIQFYDLHNFEIIMEKLKNNAIKFEFIIKDMNDLQKIDELLNHYHQLNYSLKPIYQNNMKFLQEYIFTDENDFYENELNLNDIKRNLVLDSNFFGKIFITSNCDVYENLNRMPIGNLTKETLKESLANAVHENSSWFLTRSKVEPCCNCVLNTLCPPVSNLELVLDKMNLCHGTN